MIGFLRMVLLVTAILTAVIAGVTGYIFLQEIGLLKQAAEFGGMTVYFALMAIILAIMSNHRIGK